MQPGGREGVPVIARDACTTRNKCRDTTAEWDAYGAAYGWFIEDSQ